MAKRIVVGMRGGSLFEGEALLPRHSASFGLRLTAMAVTGCDPQSRV
jgi:hypothetical protein